MNNNRLFNAGLFCLKEAVYNVLLEASYTGSGKLSNRQISEILEINPSFRDSAGYPLLRGILDILYQEKRVERIDNGKKMIWRVKYIENNIINDFQLLLHLLKKRNENLDASIIENIQNIENDIKKTIKNLQSKTD